MLATTAPTSRSDSSSQPSFDSASWQLGAAEQSSRESSKDTQGEAVHTFSAHAASGSTLSPELQNDTVHSFSARGSLGAEVQEESPLQHDAEQQILSFFNSLTDGLPPPRPPPKGKKKKKGGKGKSGGDRCVRNTDTPAAEPRDLNIPLFHPQKLTERVFDDANSTGTISQLSAVVVVSSFGQPPRVPLAWLRDQPYPVFVSTKAPGFGYHSEAWGNRGDEVSAYLHFILRFWDVLPERMLFIHGHDEAWHQQGYGMQYILRNVCLENLTYANLNAFPAEAQPGKGGWINFFKANTSLMQFAEAQFSLKSLDFASYDRCCSQFAVHRDAIRSSPKWVYEKLLELTVNSAVKDLSCHAYHKATGMGGKDTCYEWDVDKHFFEEIWHHLFGVREVNQPSMYGDSIDYSVETGAPLVFNEKYSLAKFVKCPAPSCKKNPDCAQAVQKASGSRVGHYIPGWDKRDERHKTLYSKLSKQFTMRPISTPLIC
ncbi:hypothetical protein CYMTET_6505 [Cymbomonas tetramitiformis]|uniref:Uncharacterized protein n=1 Tax=Cymbomonas tetramitiformis TaxID=36881 RepID=A0AAE0GWZ9_9CHLO|nr:hypothetical protein CYMTET_6505 [Cymbomonas tetramitiformis]